MTLKLKDLPPFYGKKEKGFYRVELPYGFGINIIDKNLTMFNAQKLAKKIFKQGYTSVRIVKEEM
jgi:hypothetical protein